MRTGVPMHALSVDFIRDENAFDVSFAMDRFCRSCDERELSPQWYEIATREYRRLESILQAHIDEESVFVDSDCWPNSSKGIEATQTVIDRGFLCSLIAFLAGSPFYTCIIMVVYDRPSDVDGSVYLGRIALRLDEVTVQSENLEGWWTQTFGEGTLKLECHG